MFLVSLHFDILITAQILLSILVNVIAQKVFKFVLSGLSVMEFGFSLAMRLVNVLKLYQNPKFVPLLFYCICTC